MDQGGGKRAVIDPSHGKKCTSKATTMMPMRNPANITITTSRIVPHQAFSAPNPLGLACHCWCVLSGFSPLPNAPNGPSDKAIGRTLSTSKAMRGERSPPRPLRQMAAKDKTIRRRLRQPES
jgi:hypothetical protein